MKPTTRNAMINGLYYLFIALLIASILYAVFQAGVIKGLADAYTTQLIKQIEMLEEEKQESMIRQILNEKL